MKPDELNGAPFPHCDSNVLHEPGKCEYCDLYPEAQQARITARINFTGETDQNKSPCPATIARPISIIDKWGGNRAKPKPVDFGKYNGTKR